MTAAGGGWAGFRRARPGPGLGAADWPGRCPWYRTACFQAGPGTATLSAGSLTACSRRRKCRRSPGRGRTRAPRGQQSRPCLRCRRGRPTWGGRGGLGLRCGGRGASGMRQGPRKGTQAGQARSAARPGLRRGRNLRWRRLRPDLSIRDARVQILKGTGACGAEGVSAERAGGEV